MAQILLGSALLFTIINIFYFFKRKNSHHILFSKTLFAQLFTIFSGVWFGFTLIYYALSFETVVLVKDLSSEEPIDHSFMNLLYFSGETLMGVGYGDMVPVGPARFFALMESAIGILIPAAYFIRALTSHNE